ncbi:hypothetical protein B0T40_10450 [Chromobacterium haemolyticum]|uniref:hypothetical protein n=1 Tax=Chromobacterium haemolyticum TaxID=394935 RepID=UPI0009D9BFFE|nr:hypothetical protein [Chromobacterium haemolyticum]OQS36798.1 hypothetical protein B0T40_10450 [Chromobacterium haemolyticum]
MSSLSIIDVMKAHPAAMSMQSLADAMGIERSEARRQVRDLTAVGTVSPVKVGNETHYRPTDHVYAVAEPAPETDTATADQLTAARDREQKLARQVDELSQRLALVEQERDKQAGLAEEALQLCQEQVDRLAQLECNAAALGFSPSAGIPLFDWLELSLAELVHETANMQALQSQLAQTRNLNRGLRLALELNPTERAALAECIAPAVEQKAA